MTPRSPRQHSDGGRLREQLRDRKPAALDTNEDGGSKAAGNGSAEAEHGDVKEQPSEATRGENTATSEAARGENTATTEATRSENTATSEATRSEGAAEVTEHDAGETEPSAAGEGKDPLALATRERDEYLALAKRTQADFENYRKRAAREIAAAGARARIGLIRELLPVVDNLERALASATDADSGLAEGVRMVLSELQGVLARAGVAAIEPEGDQFDPNVHEALSTREQEGTDTGVVLDVVEKGYKTDDMVIRPARVVVAA